MYQTKEGTTVLEGKDIENVLIETCAVSGCGELAESQVRLMDDADSAEAGGYSINACQNHREILEKHRYDL